MSEQAAQSPTQVAEAIFAALRRHDMTAVEQHTHPDVVDDFVPLGIFSGQPAVRGLFEEVFAAFPDFDIEIQHLAGDDRHAVVQWRLSGTFTGGSFQGIHATGRRVELRGCDVMRVEDGRLIDNTIYYDGLAFARQVGLLPREGSAADKAMLAAFNASTDVRSRLQKRHQEMAPAG